MNANTIFIFIILILILYQLNCYIQKQSFIIGGDNGQYSQVIVAQPQLNQYPSQYFICGCSIRQMKWTKPLYNCNCTQSSNAGIVSIKCEWCPNSFYSMRNGLKAIYCSTTNWNNQITKLFETGNTNSRNWIKYKCPINKFITHIDGRLGKQIQTDLGLVGLIITCSNIKLTQSIKIYDNNNKYQIQQSPVNSYGTFLSAIQLIYLPNCQLTGINAIYQATSIVSSVSLTYKTIQTITTTQKLIQNYTTTNPTRSTIRNNITLNNLYLYSNSWYNNLSFIKNYLFSTSILLNPPQSKFNKVQTYPYNITSQITTFDKQIFTKYTPTSPIYVVTPKLTNITASTYVQQSKTKATYQANLTFVNRLTGQLIAYKIITGNWTGTISAPITVKFQQSQCIGQWGNNNLIVNGNFAQNYCAQWSAQMKYPGAWCLWTEKTFKPNYLPGWIPRPQIEISKSQGFNKVLGSGWAAQLDVNNSTCMRQMITSKQGVYLLNVDWAARSGYKLDSLKFEVRYNDKVLRSLSPIDYNLHTQSIQFINNNMLLNGTIIQPYIQFCGSGNSDGVGAVITNIKMFEFNQCLTYNYIKY